MGSRSSRYGLTASWPSRRSEANLMVMEHDGCRQAVITAGAAVEDRVELLADEAGPFGSVLCATDGSADPRTARRQAVLLAPAALVDHVSADEFIQRAGCPSHFSGDEDVLLA